MSRLRDDEPALAAGEIPSLARSATLVIGGFAVSAVLQFGLVLVITHGLTLSTAGALFQAIALVMTAGNALLLGADAGLLRMIPLLRAAGDEGHLRRTVVVAVAPVAAVSVLVAAGTSVSAHALARLLVDQPERTTAAHLIVVMAWGIPLFAVMTVGLAGTRAFGTVVPYVAVQQILVPGLRPLFVGVTIAAGGAAVAIATAWLLPLVVGCAVAVSVVAARVRGAAAPDRPAAHESMQTHFSRFWRYAAPAMFANVFVQAVTSFDVVLVGALASTRDAAIYAAASRVILIGVYVVEALGKTLGPRLSEALAFRNTSLANALYHVTTSWMMAVLWPLYAVLMLYAAVVMRIFGHGYSAGAVSLTIISGAELFDVATGNMTLLLLMSGRSGLNLGNAAIAFALNLGLDLALIPRWGMLGAAIAWAVCIVVQNLAALLETRIILGAQPIGAASGVVAFATVAIYGLGGGLVRWLVGPSLAGLIVVAVGGSVCYGLVLFAQRQRLHLHELVQSLRPARGRAL